MGPDSEPEPDTVAAAAADAKTSAAAKTSARHAQCMAFGTCCSRWPGFVAGGFDRVPTARTASCSCRTDPAEPSCCSKCWAGLGGGTEKPPGSEGESGEDEGKGAAAELPEQGDGGGGGGGGALWEGCGGAATVAAVRTRLSSRLRDTCASPRLTLELLRSAMDECACSGWTYAPSSAEAGHQQHEGITTWQWAHDGVASEVNCLCPGNKSGEGKATGRLCAGAVPETATGRTALSILAARTDVPASEMLPMLQELVEACPVAVRVPIRFQTAHGENFVRSVCLDVF
jgi:hypothetical protein|eukprot:SAG25_NODE_1045_length_4184_cov_35.307261_5_plen_287_part_00